MTIKSFFEYKKKYIIMLLMVFLVFLYFCYTFSVIENENCEYFYKKSQIEELFTKKRQTFDNLVICAESYDDNLFFQKAQNPDYYQLMDKYNNPDLAKALYDIQVSCDMTNVMEYEDGIVIYQNMPVPGGDIQSGVRYNYSEKKWYYYFQHYYDNCRHTYPISCRLYDFFYNSEGEIG